MRLRLKEHPREWQKFTAAVAALVALVSFTLWKRQAIPLALLVAILGLLVFAVLLCLVRPRWFRLFYRVGMGTSLRIGHVMSMILLALAFLVVLTPLGVLARLLGKDPLKLRKNPDAATYWQPTKLNDRFDREF